MIRPCSIGAPRCGHVGDGVQLHHVLVTDENGDYVRPELLLPLCQPACHQAGIHRLLAVAGLDGPMVPTPGVLVGRIAVTLGWVGLSRNGNAVLPCDVLAGMADVLGPIGRALQRKEIQR